MALKGVDLTSTERRKFSIDPVMVFCVLIIFASAFVFWVFGQTYNAKIAKKTDTVQEIKKQIQEIQEKIPDIDRIKKDIADLENEIRLVESVSRNPLKYSCLMREFAKIMPSNVWIKNLSIDPAGRMSFSAEALELPNAPPMTTIAYFIKTLQGSKLFGEPNIGGASQGKGAGGITWSFNMDIPFNDAEAAKLAEGGGAR